jgi:hypothetical protein
MNNDNRSTIPVWYWVIATVALLWNLMGCAVLATEFFAFETVIEEMTEEQKEWARSMPPWLYAVWLVADLTGVAGSICLFLRKNWSIPLFAICLAAVLVQMIYSMVIMDGLQVNGPRGAVMPSMVIISEALFLWFSWYANKRGWFV